MLLRNRRGGAPGAVEEAEGRDLGRTHPCTLTGPKALCSRPSATASSGYPVPRPPITGLPFGHPGVAGAERFRSGAAGEGGPKDLRSLGSRRTPDLTGPKALCSRPSAPAPSGYPVIPPPSSPLMGAGEWGLWLWPLAGESGACTLEKGFHLASTF